ncbi:MAG TPA: hypothetical protein VKQ29_11180 [Aliidongia sp.]|nr:hypothetical protein [Aliidongia sp.]
MAIDDLNLPSILFHWLAAPVFPNYAHLARDDSRPHSFDAISQQ